MVDIEQPRIGMAIQKASRLMREWEDKVRRECVGLIQSDQTKQPRKDFTAEQFALPGMDGFVKDAT